MNILEGLQNMMGGARSGQARTGGLGGLGGLGGGLGSILNSGRAGDIARNLLTNKRGGFSWFKGALLAGAGTMLWQKLGERMQQSAKELPAKNVPPEMNTDDAKAERIIRAMVYAAKADGHIDAKEQQNITAGIKAANIGRAGEAFVQKAMQENLDPQTIAAGVTDPQEALQLYTLSAGIIDPDQFMEKSYLDALANALHVPADVKTQVDQELQRNRMAIV